MDKLVVVFVNKTLKEFHGELENIRDQSISDKKERDEIKFHLEYVLRGYDNKGLNYDGEERNAQYLIAKLQPFIGKYVSSAINERFERFVKLLPYISIFEKDGISGVNERISELFMDLKERGNELSGEEVEDRLEKLNGILYSAIYIFPHLVKSVEVGLIPDKCISTDDFNAKYEFMNSRGRWSFDRMRTLVSGEIEKVFLPLPFDHTIGKFPREEVRFESINHRDDQEVVPAVAVSINYPIVSPEYTYFAFEEVEYVRFSEVGNFTPFYDGIGNDGELIPRPSHVFHYLLFRNFANYSSFRGREDFKEVPDDMWAKYADNILEPEFNSGLWKVKYELLPFVKDKLRSGFIAARMADEIQAQAQDFMLLEFTDINILRSDTHIEAAKLFYGHLNGATESTKTYTGNEIIERLIQIPLRNRQS